MTAQNSGSLTVRDERAADALLDPATARVLEVFWDEARPVSEAARLLNSDPEALRYRVGRLVALGLLTQTAERTRPGRAMKLYRAPATAFFVPFEATRHETLESYLEQAEREVAALVRRNVTRTLRAEGGGWGLRVARGPDGRVHSKLARSPEQDWTMTADGPALLSFVYPALRLDYPDAKALQTDLVEVFSRYAARGGAQTYLCQMVLCPLTESG